MNGDFQERFTHYQYYKASMRIRMRIGSLANSAMYYQFTTIAMLTQSSTAKVFHTTNLSEAAPAPCPLRRAT